MKQYIDKSVVITEINRRIAENKKDIERASHKNLEDYFEGYEDALVLFKEKFLDTLEVKEVEENYIQHYNMWWWGKTITLIHNKGWASVEIQFDNNYPNAAFIKSLIVFEYKRKEGIGTDLLLLSEELVKSHGKRFIQLSADISNKWLVKWYEKNGYVIIYKDEHEYTMLKTLK